jgi:hypothetical protein
MKKHLLPVFYSDLLTLWVGGGDKAGTPDNLLILSENLKNLIF